MLEKMLGERTLGPASLLLRKCEALPAHMQSRTREIVNLHIKDEGRRSVGHGTALLEQVTREADEAGKVLVLLPEPYDNSPLSVEALTQWYVRRFGFQAIQSNPIMLARMPGATPRMLKPVATAAADAVRVVMEAQ
jgi:N-acetylglutamate synthase-like GNAT family acetyltransferase